MRTDIGRGARDFEGSFFSIFNSGTGYVAEVCVDTVPGVSVSFFSGSGTLSSPIANPGSCPSAAL